MAARCCSSQGGSTSDSPRCFGSSSTAKPGPSVASSKSTPPGSRKYTDLNQKRSMTGVGRRPAPSTCRRTASCSASSATRHARWWMLPTPHAPRLVSGGTSRMSRYSPVPPAPTAKRCQPLSWPAARNPSVSVRNAEVSARLCSHSRALSSPRTWCSTWTGLSSHGVKTRVSASGASTSATRWPCGSVSGSTRRPKRSSS